MSDVLLIGVGNRDRADDGVGPAIADRFAGSAGVDVLVREGDLADLALAWAGYRAVIVVDAAAGRPVGSITIDDAASAGGSGSPQVSTHGLGLAEAIELARRLGRMPSRLVVIEVGGRDFGLGPMSRPLERALDGVVECVACVVEDLAHPVG